MKAKLCWTNLSSLSWEEGLGWWNRGRWIHIWYFSSIQGDSLPLSLPIPNDCVVQLKMRMALPFRLSPTEATLGTQAKVVCSLHWHHQLLSAGEYIKKVDSGWLFSPHYSFPPTNAPFFSLLEGHLHILQYPLQSLSPCSVLCGHVLVTISLPSH